MNFQSTELPLTLTVRNKSRISYTVGIHFTDSQFHNGILSCPFLMEQSDLSQGRRKLPKSDVVVQSALDIGLNDPPNLGWAIARSAQPLNGCLKSLAGSYVTDPTLAKLLEHPGQ